MIYSDREAKLALATSRVFISPSPLPGAWTSTAVDLRLDAELLEWVPPQPDPGTGYDPCFCPSAEGFNVRDIIKKYTTPHDLRAKPYRIKPRQFMLGWTREKI